MRPLDCGVAEAVVTVACADCGLQQRIPALPPRAEARCARCGRLLDRSPTLTLAVGLAWSAAMLILLLCANLFPVMTAVAAGQVHEAYLVSGVFGLWSDGWPVLALVLGAFVIALPLVRTALLTFVLAALRTRWRPPWLGRTFRYAETLRLWAMPEVLLVAGFVIYMRTSNRLATQVDPAGWCLVAAGILSLVIGRVLCGHVVWRCIGPDRDPPAGEAALSCVACDLIVPHTTEGSPCPRCARRLQHRMAHALPRTAALVAAGFLLCFPSYYFPMSYTVQPNGVVERTIFDGVRELFQAGFWYLGLIIVVVSICIPLLKLAGLAWLVVRVKRPRPAGLEAQTRVYRAIHGMGRWSNTDPLIVGFTIPLMSFHGIVQVHADVATLPFALVVALTMLAARAFDTRLLWDAADARLPLEGAT